MKRTIAGIAVLTTILTACHHEPPTVPSSNFIPTDSANKMIGSYLASLTDTATDLRSLIVDGDDLRSYLTSDEGESITNVKLMFGHTLDYINSGNEGRPCGYRSDALTLIVAGYDKEGNYVYKPIKTVLDNLSPCPSDCPSSSDASSNFLP